MVGRARVVGPGRVVARVRVVGRASVAGRGNPVRLLCWGIACNALALLAKLPAFTSLKWRRS